MSKHGISRSVIFGVASFVIGLIADYFESKGNDEYIHEQIQEELAKHGLVDDEEDPDQGKIIDMRRGQ